MRNGIHADEVALGELVDQRLDGEFLPAERAVAPADDAVVGGDLDDEEVAPAGVDDEGLDAVDVLPAGLAWLNGLQRCCAQCYLASKIGGSSRSSVSFGPAPRRVGACLAGAGRWRQMSWPWSASSRVTAFMSPFRRFASSSSCRRARSSIVPAVLRPGDRDEFPDRALEQRPHCDQDRVARMGVEDAVEAHVEADHRRVVLARRRLAEAARPAGRARHWLPASAACWRARRRRAPADGAPHRRRAPPPAETEETKVPRCGSEMSSPSQAEAGEGLAHRAGRGPHRLGDPLLGQPLPHGELAGTGSAPGAAPGSPRRATSGPVALGLQVRSRQPSSVSPAKPDYARTQTPISRLLILKNLR